MVESICHKFCDIFDVAQLNPKWEKAQMMLRTLIIITTTKRVTSTIYPM